MSQPASPQTPPVPPQPPALSSDAQTMLSQFKLLDAQKQGVGLDKLRIFYPKIGWNAIFATIRELETANKLTKFPVMTTKGTVGYHKYVWSE